MQIIILFILGVEPSVAPSGLGSSMQRLTVTPAAQLRQQELLRAAAEPPPPKEAPPDFEFIADPLSISALDLYACFYFEIHHVLVDYTIIYGFFLFLVTL